jgi:hypothetical protein
VRSTKANSAVGTFVGSGPSSGVLESYDLETEIGRKYAGFSRIAKDPQPKLNGSFSIMSLLL